MAEVKKGIRLGAAATKLGVGRSALVEHLNNNGHDVDDKPTTKLTAEMYDILLKNFQKDLGIKERADKLQFGSSKDKEVEEPVQEDTPKSTPPVAKEPPAEEEKEVVIQNITPPILEKPKVVKDAPKEPEAKEAPAKEPAKAVEEKPKAPAEPTEEDGKAKAPKLGGPKVVGKVDLSTKMPPKKEKPAKKEAPAKPVKETAKKPVSKAPAKETPKKEAPAPTPAKPAETAAPATPTAKEATPDKPTGHIQTEYAKLKGPKLIGKIQLPVEKPKKSEDKKKKPVASSSSDKPTEKKRKRARIIKPGAPGHSGNRAGGPGRGGPNRGGGRGGARGGANRGKGKGQQEEVKEVSEKEIQDKIKATMAKLSGGAKKGKDRAQLRKDKRRKHADAAEAQAEMEDNNVLELTEFISVQELANLMEVGVAQVIGTCMSLGIIVSINQRLDAEVIQLVAEEFGFEAKFISVVEQVEEEEEEIDDPADLKDRSPIVTIMGHVDHGKTSLLDYVRNANVVAGEQGGITQHIGAYEVRLESGKKITFLDTPGHEAFTAMRARGAKVTDIAIIVIAADDRIMPQTKEAISHAQAAGVPMIFAINKVDREGADPDRIKGALAEMNLLVESWGGKYQSEDISAKHGTNIESLLDKVLLEAELLELKANPDKRAAGTVVEASLDQGRGYVTSLLVQEGNLKIGDMILSGSCFGKVKAMLDERGNRVQKVGPSQPIQILGLNGAPQAGEKFKVYTNESEAKDLAAKRSHIEREQGMRATKHLSLDEIGRRLALGNFKELNVIIKGDVDGSVEALADSLLKLSTEEIQVNVVLKGVGQIKESDVMLATASDALIIGFQVRPSMGARKAAEDEGIEIRMYSVIYDAIEEVESAMEGMLEPKIEEKIVANIEVRETFKISKIGTIAGCYVIEGKMARDTKVRLIRDGVVVHTGELASLKRFKDDVKEVKFGHECGLNLKNYNDVKVGDIIEGYEEIEIKRTLQRKSA